jgi:probable RNA-binding protein EIF1AD
LTAIGVNTESNIQSEIIVEFLLPSSNFAISEAMGPPRRKVLATAEETLFPPDELAQGQLIGRVIKATGNNVYLVEYPSKARALVELPARFRSTIWIKRGSYVVVDTNALEDRDNKLGGEIVNIVRDEKAWRKALFWSV